MKIKDGMNINLLKSSDASPCAEIIRHTVATQDQFFSKIRAFFKMDHSQWRKLRTHVSVTPYNGFISSQLKFEGDNYIIEFNNKTLGFCDAPLDSLLAMTEITLPDTEFFADEMYAEHTCCWNMAIMRKQKDGSIVRFLECNAHDADFVAEALNAAHRLQNVKQEMDTLEKNKNAK